MVDASVVDTVRQYLRALEDNGIGVRFGVVFGSQVTGKANEWSDIDLLVVSEHYDRQRSREDINRLWRIAARTDSRIEPIPCGARQWTEDSASAVIEMARREGERVVAAQDA